MLPPWAFRNPHCRLSTQRTATEREIPALRGAPYRRAGQALCNCKEYAGFVVGVEFGGSGESLPSPQPSPQGEGAYRAPFAKGVRAGRPPLARGVGAYRATWARRVRAHLAPIRPRSRSPLCALGPTPQSLFRTSIGSLPRAWKSFCLPTCLVQSIRGMQSGISAGKCQEPDPYLKRKEGESLPRQPTPARLTELCSACLAPPNASVSFRGT